MPKHVLEPIYLRNDAEAYMANPYFGPEFMGLGPYRLVKWEPGSYMEFSRFDDYYRGRPPLDRVILRFISDFNTLVSVALAGSVDVADLAGNVEAVLTMKRRLEGTGHQVRTDPTDNVRHIEIQHRPEAARPRFALTDRTVRAALYHAIDRKAFTEATVEGLSPIADSWFRPDDPLRKDVENWIPQFPYDPARGQQLLAQTSWARGPDGTLVHRDTGERFELEMWAKPGTNTERELEIIADFWKAVGVAGKVIPLTAARANDRELLAQHPGVTTSSPTYTDLFGVLRLHSSQVASPANRWSGRNSGGYANPAADALQDRLALTIDKDQRIELHRQLLQEMMGDVALMPLDWEIHSVFYTRSVKGEVTGFERGWNVYEWDKE